MFGHTTSERAEGTTPLTPAPALTVVGRQFDSLGSPHSPLGNNNSLSVTHPGDHQRGALPPPAPPIVPCNTPAAPTPNISIRHWLPPTRDLNPHTSVGFGPRPPTPARRLTPFAFSAVLMEPSPAPGQPSRDTSNSARPVTTTAHRTGLPCAGAQRLRGTPPSQSHPPPASRSPGAPGPHHGEHGNGRRAHPPPHTTTTTVPYGPIRAASRTERTHHSNPAVSARSPGARPGHPRPPQQQPRGTRDANTGHSLTRHGTTSPPDVGSGPRPPTPLPTTTPTVQRPPLPRPLSGLTPQSSPTTHGNPPRTRAALTLPDQQVERPGLPRPPPQRPRGTLPRSSSNPQTPPSPRWASGRTARDHPTQPSGSSDKKGPLSTHGYKRRRDTPPRRPPTPLIMRSANQVPTYGTNVGTWHQSIPPPPPRTHCRHRATPAASAAANNRTRNT